MNLLLFVLAIIMALSSISYQGLKHYQHNATIRRIWDLYLQRDETCQFNAIVDKKFSRTSTAQKEPKTKDDADDKEDEDVANAKINLKFLISSKFTQDHPDETVLIENVLKNLIHFLYGDQPFFQEKLLTRPNILEDLFKSLRAANDALPPKQQVGSVRKLDKLKLEDPVLDDLWHQLLRTNPVSLRVLVILLDKNPESIKNDGDSDCIKVSLSKFLYERNSTKIRLWLTPRALLYALVQNEQDVNQISNWRIQMHKEVRAKKEPEAASKEFEQFCRQFSPLVAQEKILDFKVSTTDPTNHDL